MADVLTLPVSYSSVEDVFETLPDIGSITNITSSQIANTIGQAQALVDSKISRNYALPISAIPPLLNSITTNIAIYYLLSRRMFSAKKLADSPWPDRYKEDIDTLNCIAEGTCLLIESDGDLLTARTDVADVKSNTSGYQQTFHEGPQLDQIQDPDKIEDLQDDRDI